jgi:hypothetical protein
MCNDRDKIQMLPSLKNLKSIIKCASQQLVFESQQISIAENHIRFQVYISVFSVAVYITTDK